MNNDFGPTALAAIYHAVACALYVNAIGKGISNIRRVAQSILHSTQYITLQVDAILQMLSFPISFFSSASFN